MVAVDGSSRSSSGWLFSNTEIYKPLKPFWLSLELIQGQKSTSTFRLSLYLACFADSETHCVCPTRPSYDRALQQGLGHWLCSQNLRLSPDNLIARWPAGAQTWTQTWTMFPDQLVIKVLSASKVLVNKLSGIWIHLGPLKMPKLRQAVSCFQPSSPRMSRSTRAKLNSALII